MKLVVRNIIFAAAFGCMLVMAAAAQNFTVLHPDGTYVQAPTGMSYPVAVDDFQRSAVIRYRPDGSDESAGYNRPGTEIGATVYVFPSPSLLSIGSPQSVIEGARVHLCQAQFQSIQNEIKGSHPDAALVSQGEASLTQAGASFSGYKAAYNLTNAHFFGRNQVPSISEVYVFCFLEGKWTAEYRIDYPAVYDASEEIASFMRDLTLTIPPEAH